MFEKIKLIVGSIYSYINICINWLKNEQNGLFTKACSKDGEKLVIMTKTFEILKGRKQVK